MLRFELPQLKAQLQLTQPHAGIVKTSYPQREAKKTVAGSMSRRSNILVSDIFQQGTTQTTEARVRPTASLVTSNEPEVEVVGGRKVWEMLKACTVKSVFSRFCSNTTAEVKHKIRMFNLATHWFVIHDS